MGNEKVYHLLQNVIFPTQSNWEKASLFIRPTSSMKISFNHMFETRLKKDDFVDLSTFFNAFSHQKWLSLTSLETLSLHLCGSGDICIKILAFSETAAAKCIVEKHMSLSKTGSYIDLPAPQNISGQIVAIQINAFGNVCLTKLQWVTEDAPKRDVNLAAVITTFKREDVVSKTIKKFRDHVIPYASNNIELYVVDNGSSVELDNVTDKIHLYNNINLGGAGGFARGLIELQKNGHHTHALFMDDDAACEPESIWRSCKLLAYANDEKLSIAGGMFHSDAPNIQYEKGAIFSQHADGTPWVAQYNYRDLFDIASVASNDFVDLANYGAWWFFAFPVNEISHYSFPFFVRGDDIDFSIRNKLNIVTLNGIASWCENFGYKVTPSVEYLAYRSCLALAFMHGDFRRVKATLKFCYEHIKVSALHYQYGCANAVLDAVEDACKGPTFFATNPSPIQKLRELNKRYPGEKLSEENFKKLQPIPRNKYKKKKLLGILSAYGLLLPKRSIKKQLVHSRIPWDVGKWDLIKTTAIAFGVGDKTLVFARDRKALASILYRLIKTRLCLMCRLKQIQYDYKEKSDLYCTKEYWETRFNR